MGAIHKLVAWAALALAGYALLLRPRLRRWGATEEEVTRPYPGATLIPDGTRGATNAVTITAPPARVWPWLVQMGYGRAGWYSWDHLDNFGHASADRLHPEWQQLTVGDHLPSDPANKTWWEVAALEPERFLALRASYDLRLRPFDPAGPRPRCYTDSTWCWLLEELPGGRTRVVESGYWAFRPRWLQPLMALLFLDIQHWVMQTRQFANLKRLAEGAPTPPALAQPGGTPQAAGVS
jgi:proline iminopeptidase